MDAEKEKLYRVYAYMGANEYGNDLMDKAAREIAKQHAHQRPLAVLVQEHAGWWLDYLFGWHHDGLIVGTANDEVQWRPEQRAAIQRLQKCTVMVLAPVRR